MKVSTAKGMGVLNDIARWLHGSVLKTAFHQNDPASALFWKSEYKTVVYHGREAKEGTCVMNSAFPATSRP